jgi:hypothetical protein
MHTYTSSWLFDLYDDHPSTASAASFEENTAAASSEEPDPMALPKTLGGATWGMELANKTA